MQMKFRLIDKITGFKKYEWIETVKAISLEEYSLLEPWGRKGAFPETLILQIAVESAALFAAASSEFRWIGLLDTVEEVRFLSETAPGDVLHTRVRAENSGRRFGFVISASEKTIARGGFVSRPVPLADFYSENDFRIIWEALYVPTA